MRPLLLLAILSTPLWATGAGLYCVTSDGLTPAHVDGLSDCTASKTYNSISAAKDALNTDQGTVPFTATQTIRVYPGTYTAIGYTYKTYGVYLVPTATYSWIITGVSPSQSITGKPLISCGGATTDAISIYRSPYVTVEGFEVTNCRSAVTFGSAGTADHATVAYNYIHGITGFAIQGQASATNAWVHHNTVGADVAYGIYPSVNTHWLIEYNEVKGSTAGNLINSGGATSPGSGMTVRNNILYGGVISVASGVQSGNYDAISDNVSYDNRYGIQSQISSSPGPTLSNNIVVANLWTCHYECGTSNCFGLMQHNFCYRSTNGTSGGQVMRINTSGTGSQAYEINNISWPNKAVGQYDRNIFSSIQPAGSMSDYNLWWVTGTVHSEGVAEVANTNYATLSAYQAAGWDTHSFSANPRIIGDPDLLATSSQVFPECPTIECRLAKIRRNYMPTNLALKGKGCAWNSSAMTCTPDHSDIGPVPITVYNAPGITGGGVY